jgi:hypothetical protein
MQMGEITHTEFSKFIAVVSRKVTTQKMALKKSIRIIHLMTMAVLRVVMLCTPTEVYQHFHSASITDAEEIQSS